MKEVISAQVILKWSESPPNSDSKTITSETIGNYRIEPSVLKTIRDFFAHGKFETGSHVANNFSITASKQHFEHYFKVKIRCDEKLGCFIVPNKSSLLPLEKLPTKISQLLESITFVKPPQFF